ncbi:hypothetical protein PMG11_01232 [Penicillium brasilianum]|uniref:DUF1772-domain-containing protein n=1 Tax=Penicillium brasilianum TaxID=104259 RepID=A0A0F7THI2_PENBI|nr:hypothetical protein PMG11_01232 [Penicillium brasilianum]
MASTPIAVRAAHFLGLAGAAWLSGNIAALSMNAVPGLVRSRDEHNATSKLIVRQWKNVYEAGKTQNPPVAIVVAASFIYSAWSVNSRPPLFQQTAYSRIGLFSVAAILTLSIVPYTLIAMSSTNNALLRLAASKEELLDRDSEQAKYLLEKWKKLNSFRSLLPLAGAMVGMVALAL